MLGIHNCCGAKLRFARPEGRKAYPCYLTVQLRINFRVSGRASRGEARNTSLSAPKVATAPGRPTRMTNNRTVYYQVLP